MLELGRSQAKFKLLVDDFIVQLRRSFVFSTLGLELFIHIRMHVIKEHLVNMFPGYREKVW